MDHNVEVVGACWPGVYEGVSRRMCDIHEPWCQGWRGLVVIMRCVLCKVHGVHGVVRYMDHIVKVGGICGRNLRGCQQEVV